eukprot:SAG31_NODE_1765_length_7315_cov_58.328991_2_plen_85_part_00
MGVFANMSFFPPLEESKDEPTIGGPEEIGVVVGVEERRYRRLDVGQNDVGQCCPSGELAAQSSADGLAVQFHPRVNRAAALGRT